MPELTQWPDGAPNTGVVIEDHACDRYRQRYFDPSDQDLSDTEIKAILTAGIQGKQCSFMRCLPGKHIWLVQFAGNYMPAARDKDGSMHIVSYYGSKKELLWYHNKAQARITRKARMGI